MSSSVARRPSVCDNRVNQTRAQGYRVYDSLMEAGSTRLRPIYMTANTTVIGLVPMTGWLAPIPWIGPMCAGAGLELLHLIVGEELARAELLGTFQRRDGAIVPGALQVGMSPRGAGRGRNRLSGGLRRR